MKRCPKCSREYTDAIMRFCLDDGAVLQVSGEPAPTMAVGSAPETVAFESSRVSSSEKSFPVAWLVAGLAIFFAGLVVIASIAVLIATRSSSKSPSAPGVKTESPTPPATDIVNLAGTRWTDTTTANVANKNYYFDPNGTINNNAHDTWQQDGRQVVLEFNDGYARYEGTINGNRIDYKAHNKMNFDWTATLIRDQ